MIVCPSYIQLSFLYLLQPSLRDSRISLTYVAGVETPA